MKQKWKWMILAILVIGLLQGCGNATPKDKSQENTQIIADGKYWADFQTDSSMFHVNEAYEGKGILSVTNGVMTIHIVMPSQNVVNLYSGLAEDAQKEGAELICPSLEEVTYSDGLTEMVNAFDVPVPVLDEEFDLALIGTKEKWYDHKVKVSNVRPMEDGTFQACVRLSGGSGKATVDETADMAVIDGKLYATITWSSPNYDYMLVDGVRFENEAVEGENSVFTIPVLGLGQEIPVIADTTAMSQPHEIEYTLFFAQYTIDFSKIEWESDVELSYATQFSIQKTKQYALITIVDSGRFLLVMEQASIPKNIPDDVTVLHQPMERTYLVSSSVVDLLREIDALSKVRLIGIKEDKLYIDEAVAYLENGQLIYAGKYNAPDYELILKEKCDFAIENTMIYHEPKVKEKLEELGIPVLVERSSYEKHPLGRLEWIKLYGLIFGKEEEANLFFEKELDRISQILMQEKAGLTIAYFYVNSNGVVNIRKPNDYIAKMIELSGGNYAFADIVPPEENALSSMNIQMEDFYLGAKDADILIYNSTIEGELQSLDDLVAFNPLFKEFAAVKAGHVYCTTRDFFQESTAICNFMEDLYHVMNENDNEAYHYLTTLR